MGHALTMLARVIKTTERDEVHEVHAYATQYATDIADELHMSLPAYLEMLDEQIRAALPARLTKEMQAARAGRKDDKLVAMQRAADVMGEGWLWSEYGWAKIDLRCLLEDLTAGPAWLAFPHWDMAVSLEPLRRWKALGKRQPAGWWATVDKDGLHIKWGRSPGEWRGGINLRAHCTTGAMGRRFRDEGVITCNYKPSDLSVYSADVCEAAE